MGSEAMANRKSLSTKLKHYRTRPFVSIRRVPPTASRLKLSCVGTGALVSAGKGEGFMAIIT